MKTVTVLGMIAGSLVIASMCDTRAATPTSLTAAPVDNLLATWGINTHMEYTDGEYDGDFDVNGVPPVTNVINELKYLSSGTPAFMRVRDGLPDVNAGTCGDQVYPAYKSAIQQMVAAGIGFTMITGDGDCTSGDGPIQTIAQTISQLEAQAALYPRPADYDVSMHTPALNYIEGPNEINTGYSFAGGAGNPAGITWGKQLYTAKLATAALADTDLTDFTTNTGVSQCVTGYLADEANEHPYPNDGTPPGYFLSASYASDYANVPTSCPYGLPKSATEDGYASTDAANIGTGLAYCSNAGSGCASGGGDINRRETSQSVQMKMTLDMAMDAYADGLREIDFYQLLSAYSDPQGTNEDSQYGFFNYNGTPKPVAIAFHNLTTTLADASAYSTAPHALSLALSAIPASGSARLFSTYDGSRFFLVVWSEPNLWNSSTNTETDPPGMPVRLTLAAPASIALVDPIFGTSPRNSCARCSSLTGIFGAHPEVFVITPTAG